MSQLSILSAINTFQKLLLVKQSCLNIYLNFCKSRWIYLFRLILNLHNLIEEKNHVCRSHAVEEQVNTALRENQTKIVSGVR